MDDASRDDRPAPQRPWEEVARAVADERARRYRATGSAAPAEALWATECELRESTGYARSRELDLQHHLNWRRLLEQLASKSSR